MASQHDRSFEPDEIDNPNMGQLVSMFESDQYDIEEWLQQQETNYNVRYARWAGQSPDNRKHTDSNGVDPFPFDGASDIQVFLADEGIRDLVSLAVSSFKRATVIGRAVEPSDQKRAQLVSMFGRDMLQRIKDINEQCEQVANQLFQKGFAVTMQTYEQEDVYKYRKIRLDEINQELSLMIEDEMFDEDVIEIFMRDLNLPSEKRSEVKKSLKELRKNGEARFLELYRQVDEGRIRCLDSSEEFFMPAHARADLSNVDRCHVVEYMTPEDLRSKANLFKWDDDVVEKIIKTANRGLNKTGRSFHTNNRVYNFTETRGSEDRQIEIVRTYRRISDKNGVKGIYETIYNKDVIGSSSHAGDGLFLKHGLFDYAHGDFPFVVTTLENVSYRAYDSRGIPHQCIGYQQQLKAEIDSTIDSASMAIGPMIIASPGGHPRQVGPFKNITEHPGRPIRFESIPVNNRPTEEIRRHILEQASRLFGRSHASIDPNETRNIKQFYVQKVLEHMRKAMNQLFSLYQQYGQDQMWIQVLGSPDALEFKKNPGERVDFHLDFDVLTNEPEIFAKEIEQIVNLANALGTQSMINSPAIFQALVTARSPVQGQSFLLQQESGTAKAVKEAQGKITSLLSGIPVDVMEGENYQTNLGVAQQYQQQPEFQILMQKAQQGDQEAIIKVKRLQRFVEQNQFQLEQIQNAQRGIIGGKSQAEIMQQ